MNIAQPFTVSVNPFDQFPIVDYWAVELYAR